MHLPCRVILAFSLLAAAPVWAQTNADDQPMEQGAQKATAQLKLPPARIAPNVPLNPRERAVQMLSRFAYGPRPGDVERVLALGPGDTGAAKWFEQQLNPGAIPDPAWDARSRDYPTLGMSAEQTLIAYPTDGYVRQVADGKRPYPADPLLDSLYEVQVYRYQQTVVDKDHPAPTESDEQKAVFAKSRAGRGGTRDGRAAGAAEEPAHGRVRLRCRSSSVRTLWQICRARRRVSFWAT